MKNLLSVILTLVSFTNPYEERQLTNPYFPIDTNKTKYFLDQYGDTLVYKISATQKRLNGQRYFTEEEYRISQSRKNLIHEFYYRNHNGDIFITQEGQTQETLFLPLKLKVGQSWPIVDNDWKLEVAGLAEDLTIKKTKYTGLLKIREYNLEIPQDTAIYFSYYKKDIGLIARTRNNVIEKEFIRQE